MLVVITSVEDFDKYLQGSGLVVVDFTASWCGPCKAIAPIFKEYSEDDANKNVVFLKVDVDEMMELASRYSVQSMPTFLFFKGGKKIDSLVGANKGALKDKINQLR